MDLCVLGCGYVGLTSAICFGRLGNNVICLDKDAAKIESLQAGKSPIFEANIDDFLGQAKDNLVFTTDPKAMHDAEVIFIAVATPVSGAGVWDLSQIEAAATTICQNLNGHKVIVNKCTAPVGTTDGLARFFQRSGISPDQYDLVSNPEFLREGSAISDFIHPQRIVLGSACQSAIDTLLHLYKPIIQQDLPFPALSANSHIPVPTVLTNAATAEMIKYASNSFLAAKVSFINEIGNICKGLGVDVREVARGMGLDNRISPHHLEAGLGFGGSCLPKDVRALISMAKDLNYQPALLEAVLQVNDKQPLRMVQLAKTRLHSLNGKRVAVLGLAFKPDTDDVRESPSIPIIEGLLQEGAIPIVYDPQAMGNFRNLFGGKVRYGQSAADATSGADCVMIVTAWTEFKNQELYTGRVVIDGRGIFARSPGIDCERVC